MSLVTKHSAPTSLDVARLAGVSQITVSRAFSGKLPVGKATREKIMQVAKKINYRPDVMAQSLRVGKTKTIGMICPLIENSPVNHLAYLMEKRNYMVFHIESPGGYNTLESAIKNLIDRRVDALVVRCPGVGKMPQDIISLIESHPIPVVIHSDHQSQMQVNQVVHNTRPAYQQLVKHLKNAGRKKIAILCEVKSNYAKVFAIKEASLDHGLNFDDSHILDVGCADKSQSIFQKIGEVFKQYQGSKFPFDAIVCSNDTLGCGTYQHLKNCGLEVPDDVAVVGFDNNPWCECVWPQLASIERNDRSMAEKIEKLIAARLEDQALPIEFLHVDYEFVMRDSAGVE